MPRPSASPALRVLRTLRTGSRMTLRRHKDFLALAGALQKIAGYRGLLAVRASPFPWLAANERFLDGLEITNYWQGGWYDIPIQNCVPLLQ